MWTGGSFPCAERGPGTDPLETDAAGQANCDAVDSAARLPVIEGSRWFGPEPGPLVLRIELPVTCEEMVAALYGAVDPDEIASDEDLCGSVAVTLLIDGLPALKERVARLHNEEERGAVESPAFLAMCRDRVAALIRTRGIRPARSTTS